MGHEDDQEGMSTGKKIAAGAAVGLAVPAAVGVAKKLMGDGDDGDAPQQQKGARQESRARSGGSTQSRSGKTRSTSSSTRTRSSSRARSAAKSHTSSGGRTKEQLYNQAKRLKIEGRSSMTKAQLERAISRKR